VGPVGSTIAAVRQSGRTTVSLCQNHALLDGNERLAWAAAVTFLALNGVPVPDVAVDAAEGFMLSVADGKNTDLTQIEKELRSVYGR
jgi:death-on-curing protein